ncbi:hypothetical protein ASO20_00125 [Mycoplasma sp. (ex Biomphalaria glabrata)]|uniref:hypothetical protein n=1 Tax=Mycoplasma sp. (ex Biomphalaria glabrata) TaxID=1749074 RepID=UPI00073AA937|nr:hypothetical protein [Mycoplasma sp. (ex Biomphalaria glabrata)]ALV23087.1 hypothetical protein ASO20_00125 [Mycoplasma sp. (ex Biomphalaria glabrata)]
MNLDLIVSIISLVISSFLVIYISRITWSHNIYIRSKVLKDLILVKYYDKNDGNRIDKFLSDFYNFHNAKTEYNLSKSSSAKIIENLLKKNCTNKQILKLIFTLNKKVRVERHLSIMENYIKDIN